MNKFIPEHVAAAQEANLDVLCNLTNTALEGLEKLSISTYR
jgi:hypothetical protein